MVAAGQPASSSSAGRAVPAGASCPRADGPAACSVHSTDPISDAGPLHRILEGTVIDTVLTNRLDGSVAAPVNCLVTNPIYSHSGQQVVIPAGARVLGETKPVQALGETRLAVAFHRVLMPDGSTFSLDQFLGLNQIGDAGLRDQVNQHYCPPSAPPRPSGSSAAWRSLWERPALASVTAIARSSSRAAPPTPRHKPVCRR